ncbi:V-type ATP synthase subunit D [Methanobrevibacter smithii]|uniref:V-type ATP synthase subunit D n=1 Tax=Methanobrevibacter smithii TaxID=2173 RepID=UPI00384FB832
MAQDIIDGINPTRMELLSLKNRTKLAVKGHGLLKEKRDALIKEFFDILDRVKGVREAAERSLKEANEALLEAQIAMGDLAVRKASLSVKESIDVDIKSRSVMGVSVPVTNVKMEERSIIDRGYSFSDTTIQLDEAAKKFEKSIKFLIELGEVEKTIFLLAEEIEATKRRVNALEHIMIPRFENTEKNIDMRLQEMERENFVRLKMIRSTIEKKDNEAKEAAIEEEAAEVEA